METHRRTCVSWLWQPGRASARVWRSDLSPGRQTAAPNQLISQTTGDNRESPYRGIRTLDLSIHFNKLAIYAVTILQVNQVVSPHEGHAAVLLSGYLDS